MTDTVTGVLIGAGNRGMTVYGAFALKNPEKLKFVAVAEPNDARRELFATKHKIPINKQFKTWEELFKEEKMADTAVVCTQDQMHAAPTIKALEKGYDVLLEKPMAHTLEDCVKIVKKVEETKRILGVSHVLRYTNFFSKIKDIIQRGELGTVINITHRENVMWFHMAHSFVRGNWGVKEKSSPMILAKCCHDLDLLYWMVGSNPKKVSSFGSLTHFKSENAPESAPKYCVEGCPAKNTCLYYAPRIYVDIIPVLQVIIKSDNGLYKFFANLRMNHLKRLKFFTTLIPPLKQLRYFKEWPVEPMYHGQPEPNTYSDEEKMKILKTSPYGRCVYRCDNDVVDHQLVNIEFENKITANLTMQGHSYLEGRTLRIDGTKATLIGEFLGSGEKITICDHYTGTEKIVYKQKLTLRTAQHGGGDFLLIDGFLKSVLNRESQPLTNARASLESHLLAFAAEDSRLNYKIIDMEEFRKKANDL